MLRASSPVRSVAHDVYATPFIECTSEADEWHDKYQERKRGNFPLSNQLLDSLSAESAIQRPALSGFNISYLDPKSGGP